MTASNIIEYSFFEKPTAPNRCLQADTALNQNSLVRSLSNEVGRRLDSFSETVPMDAKIAALDKFSQKLLNSGHSLATVRNILVGGIKGYRRKVARSLAAKTPIHRSSQMSAASRRTKKLLARTNWFRTNRDEAETGESSQDEPRVATKKRSAKPRGGSSVNTHTGSVGVAAPQSNTVTPGAGLRYPATETQPKQELRTSTVLFVEFSQGGSLQKCMREVLDRLTSMLGFKVRVTERGGTTLGSLLSNKNLWAGTECGRVECQTCKQDGEKKEPCSTRNVVYESECGVCNPAGSRRLADKDGLAEKRDIPSLYVGETARSVMERAAEHWADGLAGKDESHMADHQAMAHASEQPNFNFTVVKHCTSSLERQVREAVRIQMRGLVLNRKGTFNRCKLTRLVLDTEWEDKMWKESWEPREDPTGEWEGEDDISISVNSKTKRTREGPGVAGKKTKLDDEIGHVWGEPKTEQEVAKQEFLESRNVAVSGPGAKQSTLQPVTGMAWVVRELLKEVANSAVAVADLMEGVNEWEDWSGNQQNVFPRRSEREEKYLWAMLRILDKESASIAKRAVVKKKKAVDTARKRMGVTKSQPGIKDAIRKKSSTPPGQGHMCSSRSGWKSSQGAAANGVSGEVLLLKPGAKPEDRTNVTDASIPIIESSKSEASKPASSNGKSLTEGEGCVNTHTGSVEVAAPQSNIVNPGASQWHLSSVVQPEASVGMSQPNIMMSEPKCVSQDDARMQECMSDARNEVISMKSNKPSIYISESAMGMKNESIVIKESSQSKLTFELCNVTGGKFNLKKCKQNSNSNLNNSTNSSKSNNTGKERNNTFSGESFNGIGVVCTPTKRKFDSRVSSLRSLFDSQSANQSGQSIEAGGTEVGSPAKRRKWGRGHSGVSSVTPGLE